MAVRSKEDFFNLLHSRLGEDSSDEAISFMEDMTDTYNDLESRANANNGDWEKRYHDLDETWKKRYRHRFMNGNGGVPNIPERSSDEDTSPEEIGFEDLFKVK